MKRLLMHIFTIFLCIGVTTQSVYATSSDNNDILEQNFVGFDENGNLNTYNTNELEQEVSDATLQPLPLRQVS